MKVTKLTSEQKQKLTPHRQKHIDSVLNNTEPVDKESLREYFKWFYKRFKIADKAPKVILVDSPKSIYLAIALTKRLLKKENEVRNEVWNEVRNGCDLLSICVL
jgi:adenylate kinase family enzyme